MRSLSCGPLTDRQTQDSGADGQRRDRAWGPLALSAAACLVTIVVCSWPVIPLGVPGEWTWVRLRADILDGLLAASAAAIVAGSLLTFVFIQGLSRGRRPGGRAVLLGALWLSGILWAFAAQQAPPLAYAEVKWLWVPYSPASSGYFLMAVREADDVREFLRGYEERMRAGDVLHEGTHPPGLVLWHRGLIGVCRASPVLTDLLLTSIPAQMDRTFRTLEQKLAGRYGVLTDAERAALWLGVLLTHGVAVGTMFPLYALVRLDWDAPVAWCVASLWALLPAVSVFAPKSDVLYPALAAASVWLWIRAQHRGRWWSAIAAGGLLWCGLWLSLAFLPVLALMLAITTLRTVSGLRCETDKAQTSGRRSLWTRALAAQLPAVGLLCGTLAVLSIAASLSLNMSLLHVWVWNYRNHAAFYDEFSRTYLKWLIVNPLEFACALGLPVAVLCLWGFLHRSSSDRTFRATQFAVLLVLAALWISGKNQGEAARLWIILMPFAVWLSANVFAGQLGGPRATRHVVSLLILQMLASLITVAQVGGFHFDGLTAAAPAAVMRGGVAAEPNNGRGISRLHTARPQDSKSSSRIKCTKCPSPCSLSQNSAAAQRARGGSPRSTPSTMQAMTMLAT